MSWFQRKRLGECAAMALASLGLVGATPLVGDAQSAAEQSAFRGELVFYGDFALPVGEFGDNVDVGGGGGLAGVWLLDADGMIGLRADATFVLYGYESERRRFSLTVPEVGVDVRTTNYIVTGGVGPQIFLATGPIRPYVFGTVGVSYFATETTVGGGDRQEDIASSTNLRDTSLALTGGGGFSIRVSSGVNPVSLDFGASYQYNGETEYLTSGNLEKASRRQGRRFVPILSQTNMAIFRVGVTLGTS